MRAVFLGGIGAALTLLAATGMAETAFYLAMAFSVGEIASLCAADLYYIGCAAETDSQRLRSRQADALILMCVGCLVLYGVNALVPGLPEYLVNCAAGFVVGRVLFEMLRVEGNRGTAWCLAAAELLAVLLARFSPAGFYRTVTFVAVLGCVAAIPKSMIFQIQKPTMALCRQLTDALRARALYLVPATAACIALYALCGVQTILAFCAGLTAFSALSVDSERRGEQRERFPARWLIGGAATALCVALGWNGVFSALYCAWGVICALLFAPGRRSGREWLCALLCALQGLCGLLLAVKGVLAVPLACALLLPMALLLRGALYAAWLPLRAWFIRRRAGR